jgi:hypothetical protein
MMFLLKEFAHIDVQYAQHVHASQRQIPAGQPASGMWAQVASSQTTTPPPSACPPKPPNAARPYTIAKNGQ